MVNIHSSIKGKHLNLLHLTTLNSLICISIIMLVYRCVECLNITENVNYPHTMCISDLYLDGWDRAAGEGMAGWQLSGLICKRARYCWP